jgi:enoyl-CoA hydratase
VYDLPDELDVRADGPVRIVTLNRPEQLNAVTGTMHEALSKVWDRIAADGDARAVVLTGAGKAFNAGADFGWMTDYQTDESYRNLLMIEARKIITSMAALPQPLIAAVNGPAVGLGASLAVSCDIVYMSERAFIADPHVGIGLVCGDGGAATWPLLTSLMRAKEFLFTGDRISAETAVQLGLANRVVAATDLMDDAVALAHRLASMPQRALFDTKRALNMHLERAMAGVLDFAIAAERETMASDEHIRLVAAMRAHKG